MGPAARRAWEKFAFRHPDDVIARSARTSSPATPGATAAQQPQENGPLAEARAASPPHGRPGKASRPRYGAPYQKKRNAGGAIPAWRKFPTTSPRVQ
jgi:hypothetical protein